MKLSPDVGVGEEPPGPLLVRVWQGEEALY